MPSPHPHYALPPAYAHLSELAAQSPEQNPRECALYAHSTLEEAREGERVRGGEEDGDRRGCLRGGVSSVMRWVGGVFHGGAGR